MDYNENGMECMTAKNEYEDHRIIYTDLSKTEITTGRCINLDESVTNCLLNGSETENRSLQAVHVEICVKEFSVASRDTVSRHVLDYLRRKGCCNLPAVFDCFDGVSDQTEDSLIVNHTIEIASSYFLAENITSLRLTVEEGISTTGCELALSVDLQTANLILHVYQLVSGDEANATHETVEVSSEVINGGSRWLLPSPSFDGLWESLVFDTNIKHDLLSYSHSALLFADYKVSPNIISWNRVILFHGPPGTGKTSVCRGLAHKLSIRLSHRFTSTALIEINTINLMSKWFSESARLVSRIFTSIAEYLEDREHLVCLLVDEVESLTSVRNSTASACEPSDAIRVVNAVLTHLDQIKQFPNVLVLATSNVTGVLDPAFLDRADIRAYIGPPSPAAIYTIYCSCLGELMRVGLVEREKTSFLSHRVLAALKFVENQVTSASLAVWKLAEHSVGLNGRTLRKLPLLAHAFFVNKASLAPAFNHPAVPTIYPTSCVPRCVEKPKEYTSRHPCPLPVYLMALSLAVDSQLAERAILQETLEESSLGKRVQGPQNKRSI